MVSAATLVDSVWYRMAMLVLICLFGIGGYMAYDSVGVVETEPCSATFR
jgi:hypothetical protein